MKKKSSSVLMLMLMLVLSMGSLACLDLQTTTTSHRLCTAADQEAGTCNDPFGSWAALRSYTEDWAWNNYPAAIAETKNDCGYTQGNSTRGCKVTLDFGAYVIKTVCEQDPGDAAPHCSSWQDLPGS